MIKKNGFKKKIISLLLTVCLIVSMLGTVVGVSAEEFVDGTQLEEKIDTEENLENKIEDNIEEDGIEELVSDEIQEEDAEKAENIDSEIADLEMTENIFVDENVEELTREEEKEDTLEVETSDQSENVISGICGDNLTWTLENGVLRISGEGKMYDFCLDDPSIDYPEVPWQNYKAEIKKLIVDEGVTYIGLWAFVSCRNLKYITFPSSLKHIGTEVFTWCRSLESIKFSEGLDSIGYGAFQDCENLKSIIFPSSLKYIGKFAFLGCTSLNNITLPSLLTVIGEDAFKECSSLKEVWLSEGINSISFYDFESSSITSLSLPASIKEIAPENFPGNLVDLYYGGTEKQWKELCKTHSWLSEYVGKMKKNGGKIYYNDNGTKYKTESNICFWSKWDSENQIAYFGDTDFNGSQVNVNTDLSFIENLDTLLGKYVLVAKRNRKDGLVGPSELLSIKPVETKLGTITTSDKSTVTIDGNTYTLAEDISFPDFYVNTFVLYHVLDNESVYVQELKKGQGTLTYWNSKSRKLKIDNREYELGTCAEEDSIKFLGDTSYTRVYVQFWYDQLNHIYKVTKNVDFSEKFPDFYETYIPPTEAEEILYEDVEEWNQAYNDYVEAVRNALREFSGTEGEKKESTVIAEAKRMQKADENSNSKYLSGNLGSYSEYAYRALAEYLYDYTCDNVEFSSLKPADIVNSVIKSLSGGLKTYHYDDDIEIGINMTILNKSGTGHLEIKKQGRQVLNIPVNTPQKEVEASIGEYLNALQDLAVDSMVNVATAVYQDILGESLSKLTEKYISKAIDKIEKKLAVKLTEKFNLAGVGDFVQGVNKCYSFYSYVNANVGHWDNIEGILGNVDKLQFKDKTINDVAVKKAMSALEKAKTHFVRSYQKYIAGTLGEEKGFFKLFFKCPVDIEVYNSQGEKIGCANETELWYDDSIEIVSQGGAKIVTVLTEDLPNVKVFSREYGTMDCTIEELNADHKPIGRLNYYNISLTPGQEYSVDVNKNLEQNKNSMVIETNGQNILADEYVSVKESAGVLISCKVESDDGTDGGRVRGSGTYIRGNAVVLSAIPDTGYVFAGWYQGDNLITLGKIYEFTARNNEVLTAKFVRIQRIYVQIKAEGGGTVSGSDKNNEYLEGEKVTVTATPDEGKIFEGWYCKEKKVSEDEKYQFSAIENVELIARFVDKPVQSCKHVFGNAKITKNATCTTEGEKYYICTICGAKKEECIPKKAHKYGKGVITKKPTIYKAGEQVVTCTVCKKKFKKTYGKKLSATIKLNIYSIVLQKKQSTSKVKVSMANGDTIKTWISSNKKVVTVDKKGVIKAQKKGNAKITVTLKSGKKATVKVKVQDSKVKTTKLNNLKSAILIKKGKTSKIQPIVSPITSQEKIVFASSNKKIATVNSKGVIEAKKKGSTTITVKSGKIVKKIKVTVK